MVVTWPLVSDVCIVPVAGDTVLWPAFINLAAWCRGWRSFESVTALLPRAWWILDTLSSTGTERRERKS